MATNELPSRSRYEFFLAKGTPVKAGVGYFDVHHSDIELVTTKG
jgi:hypothetical protein